MNSSKIGIMQSTCSFSSNSILHSVSGCSSVFNACYKRFCKLFRSASNSDNLLVRNVFLSACLSCRGLIISLVLTISVIIARLVLFV